MPVMYNDLPENITFLFVVAQVTSVPHGHLKTFLVDVQGFTTLRCPWLGIEALFEGHYCGSLDARAEMTCMHHRRG